MNYWIRITYIDKLVHRGKHLSQSAQPLTLFRQFRVWTVAFFLQQSDAIHRVIIWCILLPFLSEYPRTLRHFLKFNLFVLRTFRCLIHLCRMVTCAVCRKKEVIPSSGMVGKSLLSVVFLNKLCKVGFICALEHDQVSSILTQGLIFKKKQKRT